MTMTGVFAIIRSTGAGAILRGYFDISYLRNCSAFKIRGFLKFKYCLIALPNLSSVTQVTDDGTSQVKVKISTFGTSAHFGDWQPLDSLGQS